MAYKVLWEAETVDDEVRVNCRMYDGDLCLTDAWATMPTASVGDQLDELCGRLMDYILDEAEPLNTLPI
jgi:hypothetical protein